MIGLLVEGWHDEERVREVMPEVKCYVMNGTPVGLRMRRIVNQALEECSSVYILTDPDEAGDMVAEAIQREYPDVPRLIIDPNECKVLRGRRWKYGVEHCKLSYLREVLEGAF